MSQQDIDMLVRNIGSMDEKRKEVLEIKSGFEAAVAARVDDDPIATELLKSLIALVQQGRIANTQVALDRNADGAVTVTYVCKVPVAQEVE